MTDDVPRITTSCNSSTGEITVFLSFPDGQVVDNCVLEPETAEQGRAAWRSFVGLDDGDDE